MSQINYENARQLSKIWKSEGIKPLKIRQRLIEQGFASSEIQEIMGADYPAQAVQKKKDGTYRFEEDKEFEKSGCLTIWLLVVGFISFVSLGAVLQDMSLGRYAGIEWLLIIVFAVTFIQVAFVVALWNGKRWGYRGLMGLLSVNLILHVLSFDIISISSACLAIVILYMLMRSHRHQLV